MPRLPYFILLAVFFTSCANNNFDEATIPADQVSTEMAFKRVAIHGGLEPVLEENQEFKDWQFHIASKATTSVLGSKTFKTFYLKDKSGIHYTITSAYTPSDVLDSVTMGYGYASGKVISVKRDLAAGEFEAVLALTSWRERKM